MNNFFYFAYGSNMDVSQMKCRCPGARKIENAYLKDHALVFNRQGTYRSGGVASVESSTGKKVFGVVYSISKKDLAELDRIEDPKAYERVEQQVWLLSGATIKAFVYVSYPEGAIAPDPEYLDLILKAAKSAELPDNYLESLNAWKN